MGKVTKIDLGTNSVAAFKYAHIDMVAVGEDASPTLTDREVRSDVPAQTITKEVRQNIASNRSHCS